MTIVTLGSPKADLLLQKTERVDLEMGCQIAKLLIEALLALKKPVAGLAANQLGFCKSVFVFSWDRTVEQLELVINPTYEGVGEKKVAGWEGCLSTLNTRKIANISRFETIHARYTNGSGQT